MLTVYYRLGLCHDSKCKVDVVMKEEAVVHYFFFLLPTSVGFACGIFLCFSFYTIGRLAKGKNNIERKACPDATPQNAISETLQEGLANLIREASRYSSLKISRGSTLYVNIH